MCDTLRLGQHLVHDRKVNIRSFRGYSIMDILTYVTGEVLQHSVRMKGRSQVEFVVGNK